ncbi:TIM barrel protein [Halovulum dunhuangense]|uniref:TIM barrel protein n=1 Tax=Halovulum dunhuangense TaxID=1505036 RepID=A0A849L0S2_9RHOB|nr:TIM barrel protein [Halovulum dunhuangense]NNU79861.1 TIM barrel protein [Halovulum dunhuangense]
MTGERLSFSANLGFLWTDLRLPERVVAAKRAGFDAVECHFPYDTDIADLRAALRDTGLPMLSLNTRPGDPAAGEFGLAALPGRAAEAQAAMDEAMEYAAAIGCGMVHVMAGRTPDIGDADRVFRDNLCHACKLAKPHDIRILIEPINRIDVPGYHLHRLEDAATLVGELGDDALRIMFDCYHMQRGGGDLLRRFIRHAAMIGHVQFAGVPDRGEPDRGEVAYPWLLKAFRQAGYRGAFGAEYRPSAGVEQGLGWLDAFRRA